MASIAFEPLTIPVREDDQGALRIGNTRVLLDLVIRAFRAGATPEAIVESYDTLNLADVYAVLGYYLRHPAPIDEYLRRRDAEAEAIRQEIEAWRPPRPNLRETLLTRARAREQDRAATGQ